MPATNLGELIAWIKANPNRASGRRRRRRTRFVTAFFEKETKTRLNLVPYRGTAPRVQDLVAAQIDLSFRGA